MRILLSLCLALALTVPGTPVLADARDTGSMPSENDILFWVGPRPDIDDYEDRDRFVRDVLAWEKHEQQFIDDWQAGLRPSLADDNPGNSHDWHHVTGPEDLDVAIRNAEGYEQPNYREKYRFNRTTHVSFPLDPLAPEQMAKRLVEPQDTAPVDASATARDLAEQELVTIDEAGYLVLAPPAEPSEHGGSLSSR